jgi:hypothetical protein
MDLLSYAERMTTTEPGWVPPANDRATWENDSWAAGAAHARAEAVTSLTNQYRAELKLISTLLSSLKMTAEAHQAQLERMQATMEASVADLKNLGAMTGRPPGERDHVPVPGPDRDLNPVFDAHGHEADMAGDPTAILLWPLVSTCRCGRQITQATPAEDWQHSD